MKNIPRNHHYLSQFYLRGFSKSGNEKSTIFVYDLKNEKQFSTKAKNIGSLRDFNRIDIEEFDQNIFENDLSVFEGKVAESLKHISKVNKFESEDKIRILNFIALLAVRTPYHREIRRQNEEMLAKNIFSVVLSDKERWETIKSKNLKLKNESITYEEMKKFHESGEYSVQVSREHHIKMELYAFEVVLETLFERNWQLINTTEEIGYFITCDKPVILSHKDPEIVPIFYRYSPGHGVPNTQILFPLSKTLTLLGEFEPLESERTTNENEVALQNRKIIAYTQNQIYSPKSYFKVFNDSGIVFDGSKIRYNKSNTQFQGENQ